MRNEQLFSKGGFYQFIVQSNAILHKEAAQAGHEAIARFLKTTNKKHIALLDLACGGMPISICRMVESFKDVSFDYTGIDINPDQVQAAQNEFTYPPNFNSVDIIEGNAWVLSNLIEQNKHYDVIFTGMNLHHGTAEEICCLLLQVKSLLSSDGIFINHDLYRPQGKDYIKRPSTNPDNELESFAMISPELIGSYKTPNFSIPAITANQSHSDWRNEFLDTYVKVLAERGGDQAGIQATADHVRQRDFSLNTNEMKQVCEKAGLGVTIYPYRTSLEPLKDYYALIVAQKS
ncbi:MAG: class I SAM-dependent methyltransferase [Candidatus Obscuribacterales bacterium]|nr:class I SAM-dependent methyltransferase [Candidatus Obscuribacterales bacterium]